MNGRRAYRYDREAPPSDEPETGAELAFPKTRFVPRGEKADLSGLAIPKVSPDRDRSYLDFVRGQVCAAWGVDGHSCAGVTEAAHLEVEGKGIKASDYMTVALCTAHHRQQHNVGIATFQINLGVNLWEAAVRSLVLWVRQTKKGNRS